MLILSDMYRGSKENLTKRDKPVCRFLKLVKINGLASHQHSCRQTGLSFFDVACVARMKCDDEDVGQNGLVLSDMYRGSKESLTKKRQTRLSFFDVAL